MASMLISWATLSLCSMLESAESTTDLRGKVNYFLSVRHLASLKTTSKGCLFVFAYKNIDNHAIKMLRFVKNKNIKNLYSAPPDLLWREWEKTSVTFREVKPIDILKSHIIPITSNIVSFFRPQISHNIK